MNNPSHRARIAVALLIGLTAGTFTIWLQRSGRSDFTDFDQIWLASRALLRGENGYAAVPGPFPLPFFYPLTAGVIGFPFAFLPRVIAAGVWTSLGFALVSYGITCSAWWPLIGLVSYPALSAALLAQWSPLMTAIAVLPGLAWLAVGKPSTGGVIALAYAHRTVTWRNAVIATGIIAVTFALEPRWVVEWRDALRASEHFTALVFRPFGILLLANLLRWRRPEARMLALLAVVPHTALPYEAMPAMLLVPSTRRQCLALSTLSFAMIPFLITQTHSHTEWLAAFERGAVILTLFIYLPATVMVLRRPNEGNVAPWLERVAARLPAWLRGRASSASTTGVLGPNTGPIEETGVQSDEAARSRIFP